MELRDYQEEALAAISQKLQEGINRQLVVLPTGTGKTVIFSNLPEILKLQQGKNPRILILAHREELLLQAKNKILQANPQLRVDIEKAEQYADHEEADVVCASVATLGRDGSDRITRFNRDHFDAVVVDEAHHAAAPTYRRVLDYFSDSLHLGVTATPQRGDNTRLTDIFDEIVYYKDILEMIDKGWLCKLEGYRVHSEADLDGVQTQAGDYVVSQLAEAIDTPERNELIVRAYTELTPGSKCLVFAANVAHAENVVGAFKRSNIPVDIVVGDTPDDSRRDILKRFSEGDIQVLVNVGVLTEGFDEPGVETIILARPTRSHLLYTQICGRGTRLHPGKRACTIIDIADATRGKKPLGLPTLLGLPPDFDLEGGDLAEVAKQFNALENKAPGEAARVRNLKDIELAFERIDLFMPPPPSETVQTHSLLVWAEVGENNFWLNISAEESLHISGNALGSYDVLLKSAYKSERKLGTCDTLEESFRRSDGWVANHRTDEAQLLDSNAVWRQDPPTDKQTRFLRSKGIPIHGDLTKGQAAQIISKYLAENPRSRAQQIAIAQAKKKNLSNW